ncbi:hypothetical protein [Sediminibacterium sp.]|uniref:hypothetical protein n=1 Tax=Sediminibacterium sp. TaxID=1917865 RepID=UPI00273162E1|nr:hypothetical protein [Sediminibacterium sp.]MDP1971613.1 hypothetical protein [Sediminibacterium sp.]MDP2421255.1 hypothetical protein [Sediminibacterium sp.]
MMKMSTVWIGLLLLLIFACSSPTKNFTPAENGLDAGREFIDACLKGDFSKASFYMVDDEKNKLLLLNVEAAYREKDKEGRQELRFASINIKEVSEPNDSTVILYHSNSLDTSAKQTIVIKRNNSWLVNFKQSTK